MSNEKRLSDMLTVSKGFLVGTAGGMPIMGGEEIIDTIRALEDKLAAAEATIARVEKVISDETAARKRPTGGFYGGEHYGPEEGEEAYEIIDAVASALKAEKDGK